MWTVPPRYSRSAVISAWLIAIRGVRPRRWCLFLVWINLMSVPFVDEWFLDATDWTDRA